MDLSDITTDDIRVATNINGRLKNFVARAIKQRTKDGEKSAYYPNIRFEDFIEKVGPNPTCYLSGKPIDLRKLGEWEMDHIVAVTAGGGGEIDNLGITLKEHNRMKFNHSLEHFISLCKEVVENNGYEVKKKAN